MPDPSGGYPTTLAGIRDILLVGTLLVFILYVGAGFLIPLTVAILAFVLITAASDRVRTLLPMPVWLANLIGVAIVLSSLFVIMIILGNQAAQFARSLSTYEARLDTVVTRLTELVGNQAADAVRKMFINIDISRVAIGALGGAQSFLSTFFLICLYVVFMMAERSVTVRKVALAAASEHLGRDVSGVMRAISTSLQRYMGVKSFISLLTALFSYAVFRYLGLEFAETWAVLTFALNFIPSIGSVIAVIFPAVVSMIQFDTLTPLLIIIFGCGTVQFLIGNFLDPALLGRSLNISSLVVILALTFWAAVWGVTGAFLSVPVTVCILIVLSHIKATRPIAILMSQDGELFHDMDMDMNEKES